MELLYWFQSHRTPLLDEVMSVVTRLGEEYVFLVIAMAVFWCVDKRKGYYLLTLGFFGIMVNQWLKIACRIPRPWVKDPHFTIVESARGQAAGYSFPSGHTQAAAVAFGGVARIAHRGWLRILCVLCILLTAVSRLYLGVHTLWDVGVSLLIGVFAVLLLYPMIDALLWFPKRMYWYLGAMLAVNALFLTYLYLWQFPADLDMTNYASALKNAYSMLGSVLGLIVVYRLDNRLLHFSTQASPMGQICKLAGGFLLVLAVKTLLKEPLLSLCDGLPVAHSLRYFLVVLTAGSLWPATFRLYSHTRSVDC